MSHFTKTNIAEIVDDKAFVQTMAELGLTQVTRNATITDFYGKNMKVDVSVKAGRYDVGLVKNKNDKYDMVADWWGIGCEARDSKLPAAFRTALGVHGDGDKAIQELILKNTTKNTIANKYKAMGYMCKATEDKQGNVQLVMTKF